MQQYDTLVVGSGLGGLTAALALARAGQKVIVLEQHFLAGGYATNFQRRGTNGEMINFDVSLHGIGGLLPGGNTRHILESLDIYRDVTFIRKQETATLVLPDGQSYDIPDDFADYQQFLCDYFPDEAANIRRLFAFIREVAIDMEAVTFHQQAPKYFQQLQSQSLSDFLHEYTQNENLIEMFSFLWLYYGLPSTQLSALYYVLAWISYHMQGTFYIQGGAQALSDAYVAAIREHGGEVIVREQVVACELGADCQRITTKKGHVYTAKTLVLNGAPQPLLATMSPQTPALEAYQQQLGELELGISLTQLYIGLDCLPQEVGVMKADYFTYHYDSATNYDMVAQADYEQMDFGVVNYNLLDPTLNPEQGMLCITIGDLLTNWDQDRRSDAYKAQKAAVTETLLRRLYALFPQLEGHVTALELGTPVTMARYTHNPGGAVYGFAQSVTQAGYLRPYVKTPLANVYIASSWANPGGGYEGAMTSGFTCAQKILSDLRETTATATATLMPSAQFMQGMAAQFQPAAPFEATYQFIFTDDEPYVVDVQGKRAHAKAGKTKAPDVTITVTYSDWVAISSKTLSGEEALQTGRLVITGEMTVFFQLTSAFEQATTTSPQPEPALVRGSLFLPLALIPWIVYWVSSGGLQPSVYLAITLAWHALLFSVIKPKVMRQPTWLELGTMCCFSLLPFLPSATSFVVLNVCFVGVWLASVLSRQPITAQYAGYEYPLVMRKSQLFQTINTHLSIVWTLVFLLQTLGVLFLPAPWHWLSYSLIAVGVVSSIFYPRYRLGQLKLG